MKALILENNRIAQVEPDDKIFEVVPMWNWVTCPIECTTEWSYNGRTFSPPKPPEVTLPTLQEQFESVRVALQSAIDDKAKSFGFSSGNALILYAGFSNPFQPLAQQFASWEVTVWLEAGQYKDQVLAGTQPMLTPSEAVALMPTYPV